MPGDFRGTDGVSPDQTAQEIANPSPVMDDGKVETDVDGVFADGTRDGMPVFNVDQDDFYQNMNQNRRRLRFRGDSVKNYMKGTRYNRPFFIKFGDYLRKIK